MASCWSRAINEMKIGAQRQLAKTDDDGENNQGATSLF
jgi:hypothetical protein